jgi:FKBP-type peptidyl-prolyl cis-trans isomerase FkpA
MMVAVLAVSVAGVGSGRVAFAQTPKPETSGAGKPAASTSQPRPGKPATAASKPGASKQPARPAATPAATTEDEKALYALGVQMGSQATAMVRPLELNPAELAAFKRGMAAGIDGEKAQGPFTEFQQRLQARASANTSKAAAAAKARGTAFRDAAAAEPGATKTASGLVFRSLQPGQGDSPKPTDTVRVKYRGTLVDGTEFDASAGEDAASFPLNGVIPCWTEGLQLMKAGEKARLVCPSEIAYGDRGHGSIPPGSTLVFEIDLVGIGKETPPAK